MMKQSTVYPQEPMADMLRRAYEGFHIDIYQTIKWDPEMLDPSAGALIAAAKDALRILHRREQSQCRGKHKLPPLQEGSSSEKKTEKKDERENNKQAHHGKGYSGKNYNNHQRSDRGSFRGKGFRGRGFKRSFVFVNVT